MLENTFCTAPSSEQRACHDGSHSLDRLIHTSKAMIMTFFGTQTSVVVPKSIHRLGQSERGLAHTHRYHSLIPSNLIDDASSNKWRNGAPEEHLSELALAGRNQRPRAGGCLCASDSSDVGSDAERNPGGDQDPCVMISRMKEGQSTGRTS